MALGTRVVAGVTIMKQDVVTDTAQHLLQHKTELALDQFNQPQNDRRNMNHVRI